MAVDYKNTTLTHSQTEGGMEQVHPTQTVAIRAIDLETFSGTPLGDICILCRACNRRLTATDKLSAINRERAVWYTRGTVRAFCEACTYAAIV